MEDMSNCSSDEENDEGFVLDDNLPTTFSSTDDDIDGFIKSLKEKFQKIKYFFGSSPKYETMDVSGSMSQDLNPKNENLATNVTCAGDSDNDKYSFDHCHRGLALIINNELFKDQKKVYSDRPGSSEDAKSLVKTFRHLGFHVFLQENLTALKMLKVLHSVSRDYNHSLADCFVCIILSHGHQIVKVFTEPHQETIVHEDVVVGVDGKAVATKKVLEYFNDQTCPNLQGKPRLFFFQACRGSKVDDGVNIDVEKTSKKNVKKRTYVDMADVTDQTSSSLEDMDDTSSSDAVKDNVMYDQTDAKSQRKSPLNRITMENPAPLHKDFLVMYATPPGYYSWRRAEGTWFIQSLCKVLNRREIRQMSLIKALVQVSNLVAVYYESNVPKDDLMHKKKEMPVIQSMLVKDAIFSKKKKKGKEMLLIK
ncbi:caspase-7 [Biomphalaria glabrata]|nr:caspase-7-like [Biomphalaria glabrata]